MTPVIIGDSVRGDSHVRHNTECQDSYLIIDGIHKHDRTSSYYRELPEGTRIIAVADGHGSSSCPYSKTGSQTVANAFCDIMAEFVVKYKDEMHSLFVLLNSEGEATRVAKSLVREWEKRILDVHRLNKREVPRRENGDADAELIWKQYGTTLLGMLITKHFIFSLQLGDGDIMYVDNTHVLPVIEGDKILGVETHSISKPTSWKKVLTKVTSLSNCAEKPFMYVLSTDGWMNSHVSETEFHKTCMEYFKMIQEHGTEVVEENLSNWLSETSKMGCGDDITVVFAYFY